MLARTLLIGAALCLGGTGAPAQIIRDSFLTGRLAGEWSWANEEDCRGWVNNGLVLNPVSPFRQAAVGTTRPAYSWAGAGNARTYQFAVEEWTLRPESGTSARLFIVGNDAGTQPEPFSDYNKPNVLMAKLDCWKGVFYWNLFVKADAPKQNADADAFKFCWMDVGIVATGRTFGVTLVRDRARLWWKTAENKKFEAAEVEIPSRAFAAGANVYVAVKNDTGETLGREQYVRFGNVTVSP